MKRARMARGLSQMKLAELVPCKNSEISRIETGHAMPYANRARQIAKALGWRGEVSQLFRDDLSEDQIEAALFDFIL